MTTSEWTSLVVELQALAQTSLYYRDNVYDSERFARVREISAIMLSQLSDEPLEKVEGVFCSDSGYTTPKVCTRAAVFEDGKILLVRESTSGLWALPGGWNDVTVTPGENAVKEVREEAGIEAVCERPIAILDRNRNHFPRYPYSIVNLFFLARPVGGAFVPNQETEEAGYFSIDEIPPLDTHKTTMDEIEMCFQAASDPNWKVLFD